MTAYTAFLSCYSLLRGTYETLLPLCKASDKRYAWRLKGLITQLGNIADRLPDKMSVLQLQKIAKNVKDIKVLVVPKTEEVDAGNMVLSVKEYDRLCCAALGYCQYACTKKDCDVDHCAIRRLLDDSQYIQSYSMPTIELGDCPYAFADVAWEEVTEE